MTSRIPVKIAHRQLFTVDFICWYYSYDLGESFTTGYHGIYSNEKGRLLDGNFYQVALKTDYATLIIAVACGSRPIYNFKAICF